MVNPLSTEAREIVWGCLFGDGYLLKPPPIKNKRKDGTVGSISQYRHYKLVIRHSAKQLEYARWLYSYLKPICHSEPKVRYYIDRRSGEKRGVVDIVTRTHSFFSRLRKYFYPKGKKEIRRKWLNKLTPLGLAVWFMDDGTTDKNRKNKVGRSRVWLATNSYSYQENLIIQKYFAEKWGIKCSVVKERDRFKIAFNSDSKKFCDIIRPYIIPSMQYKLI